MSAPILAALALVAASLVILGIAYLAMQQAKSRGGDERENELRSRGDAVQDKADEILAGPKRSGSDLLKSLLDRLRKFGGS